MENQIFDTQIMAIFWVATVIPLVCLFLLSFTQGSTEIYEQLAQNQQNSYEYNSALAKESFAGIIAISLGHLALGGIFLLLLERRWGRSAFEN